MIIIDEVSMVRCDMLDAADMILRHYRHTRKPFGGIQIVMFGDLYQLMPVAVDEDWERLKEYYRSPYFFCSDVLQKIKYSVVELKKVYRQEQRDFVNLLNHIREGQVSKKEVETLNSRYNPNYRPAPDDNVVTLMTHNRMAKNYNEDELSLLPAPIKVSDSTEYNWGYEQPPAERHLVLKKGARVMFIKNDTTAHRYVNGTMGRVVGWGFDYIDVLRDGTDTTIRVVRQKWDRLEYYVDEKTRSIETRKVGSFTQFPLRLAWAVTIHKSQGLTFDNVVIDAGKAFAAGQVYVALSRCRTFEGITLTSLIPSQKITADDMVKLYMSCIDADGTVSPLPAPKEDDYEDEPLVMWVSQRKLHRLRTGQIHMYMRKVDDMMEHRIFRHDEDGELVINDIYKDRRRKWKYDDWNNGNFPFVLYKYRTIKFKADYSPYIVTFELLNMEVYFADDTYPDSWAIRCHLGKLLSEEHR